MFNLTSLKPFVDVLALPPVPLLLLVLLGARLMTNRRALGFFVVFLSVALLWLSACIGTARLIQDHALRPPPALSIEAIGRLRDESRAAPPKTAIVVLGGGRQRRAPEYGMSNLTPISIERLRYGVWLSKETTLPLAFSGGVGWQQDGDPAEADIAARIAQREFGRQLRWVENASRDTHENALRSVALLKADGISHVVVVTHANHMRRAVMHFEAAAQGSMRITPAPIGFLSGEDRNAFDWLPTASGMQTVRHALHELVGSFFGV